LKAESYIRSPVARTLSNVGVVRVMSVLWGWQEAITINQRNMAGIDVPLGNGVRIIV